MRLILTCMVCKKCIVRKSGIIALFKVHIGIIVERVSEANE